MTRNTWAQRVERAKKLVTTYPFAAEVLLFYQQIVSFQESLYGHVKSACGSRVVNRGTGSLQDELDLVILLPRFPPFLSLVERVGTPVLAEIARGLSTQDHNSWTELLVNYWSPIGDGEGTATDPVIFFARAFLQPYAEYLAEHTRWPSLDTRPPFCPLCHGKPQVGVLRQEGDGGKRSLVCSTCLTEWDYQRIVCPACGEENVDKLPIYTAGEFEYIRVEACETCKRYLKTVDLTKNGLAIPEVDELAAIPLSLWAQEKGYTKLQTNLLGL